jgi:hypothetical protein
MTACAFPPCPRDGVETLGLTIDGHESALRVCTRHAEWLRTYVEEDVAVVLTESADERQAVTADA